MKSVVEIIKEAWGLYTKKESFVYLVKIASVSFGLILVIMAAAVFSGATSFFSNASDSAPSPAIIGTILVVTPAAIILSFWIQASVLLAISKVVKGAKIIGVKDTFVEAKSVLWKYLLARLLVGFIVMLGTILLIIPGIIFSIWFSFINFFIVVDGSGVSESLRRSKELFSKRFWPVLGKLAGIGLFVFVVQMVIALALGQLSGFVSMFVSPFYILIMYLLFEDLKKTSAQ